MTSRTRVMTTLTTEDAPAAVPDGFAAPVAAPLDAGSPTPRVEVAAAIAPPATVEEPADPGPALDAVEPATEAPRDPTTPFAAGDSLFPTSTGHDDPHRPIRLDAALAPGGANNPPDPTTMVAAPHDAPPPNPAARFDSSHVAGGTAGAQPTGRPGQAQAPQGQFRPGQFPPPGFQGGQPSPYHAPNHPQGPAGAPYPGAPYPGAPYPGPQGSAPRPPQPTTMSKALGSGGVLMVSALALGLFVGALSLTCLFVAWICAMSIQVGRKWLQFCFLAGFGLLGFNFFLAISQQVFSPFDITLGLARWVCLAMIPATLFCVWRGLHHPDAPSGGASR